MDQVLGREMSGNPAVIALLGEKLAAMPLQLGEEVPRKLAAYHELLSQANQYMNLTGSTDPETAADRLYTSSLAVLEYAELLPQNARAVDVGSGAGIPGMVLAIARRDIHFLLLDALGKRVDFLKETAFRLGLQNVSCLHARAEDAARDPMLREKFDVSMARAVAPLPVLCELLLPFCRVGGKMLCYKGPSAKEELAQAQKASKMLGGGTLRLLPLHIPSQPEWEHVLAAAEKRASTPPNYPRKAGTPQKAPLGK